MSNDAIVLLREDHKEVRRLFRAYRGLPDRSDGSDGSGGDGSGGETARREAVERIVEALTVHTYLEDELLYPRVREAVPELAGEMRRAHEEHHVAGLLCEELSRMGPTDEEFDAKTEVLMDAVERHIQEEEGTWFPRVRAALGRKELQLMGERMRAVRETAPRRPSGAGVLHRVADALEG
ncbi:hemerythrin domain-containing protein [Kitasatospora sp. NPDC097605]|uniref:hemerythrin domain-containing protein n=1 Tax=Kitasatospora sp. NPDC097605 TaxID=3157226 RepID=UPI00331C99FA